MSWLLQLAESSPYVPCCYQVMAPRALPSAPPHFTEEEPAKSPGEAAVVSSQEGHCALFQKTQAASGNLVHNVCGKADTTATCISFDFCVSGGISGIL